MFLGTLVFMLSLAGKIKAEENGVYFKIVEKSFLFGGSTISNEKADSLLSCSQICARRASCKRANFISSQRTCSLLSEEQTNHPRNLLKREDSFYLEKETHLNKSDQVIKKHQAMKKVDIQGILENKSCSEIKLRYPNAPSGSYLIDPDGEGGVIAFTIDCDMTDKNNVGVTVISHDSENRTLVQGCEPAGCYKRDIHYNGVNVFQLGNLTTISAYCEQFIKYECYHAMLLHNGGMYSWWVSRDGDKMTYWGGANSTSLYKCACGVNGTCADSGYGCNCDKNDKKWRADSGLLTNKSHLPIMQLRFGDISPPDERGYHTLGKLRCYGISTK